ncbi:hypothetical protein [Vibrio phage V-YDF132]|nr:hypothetical protein [Vibrio phage V-YDF132]
MTVLNELRRLLGTETKRTSGTVKSVGDLVQVSTPNGMVRMSKPPFKVRPNDVVIIEGHQIIFNAGQVSTIPVVQV